VNRRPPTGHRVLAALALSDHGARTALQEAARTLLQRHSGSVAGAARELDLSSSRALLAMLEQLELTAWLDATWPARRRGGRPSRTRPESPV
jgi:hypothetical protein